MNNETGYEPVVPENLCYGCGLCVGICAQKAIKLKKNKNDVLYAKIDKEKCIGCNLCKKICPVNNWKKVHYLKDTSKNEIGLSLGPYVELGFGHAKDPFLRKNGSSGGMITAMLSYLLEKKEIDGAILAESVGILDGKYTIITNKKDIIKSQKSKYFCIPLELSLQEIKKYKKLAVVGSPCHIEAISNIAEIYPDFKKIIRYKLSLFCASNIYKDFYSYLFQKKNIKAENITKLDFRPGPWWDYNYFTVSAKGKSKTLSFRKGLISALVPSRLFSREACLLCPDFTGLNSDISFGDAWHPKFTGNKEGYNFYIARNKKGKELIEKLEQEKIISSQKITIDDFYSSYLKGPLIFKHEGVIERASFLKSIGKKTPKNIPTRAGLGPKLRIAVFYANRNFLLFLYKTNILKYVPEKLVILYGMSVNILARKRKLRFIIEHVKRKMKCADSG